MRPNGWRIQQVKTLSSTADSNKYRGLKSTHHGNPSNNYTINLVSPLMGESKFENQKVRQSEVVNMRGKPATHHFRRLPIEFALRSPNQGVLLTNPQEPF